MASCDSNVAKPAKQETRETGLLKELPSAINFRDVADLDSTKLKRGVLFRSSEIFKFDALCDHNIKTLLDMRRVSSDAETHPVYLALEVCDKSVTSMAQPSIYHYDMIQSSVKLTILTQMPKRIWHVSCSDVKMMCEAVANPECLGFEAFYKILIDKSGSVIADSLRVFADAANLPVLFHCTHGKDRAGILCCLLGLLAGVDPKAICQDYVESGMQLKAAKEMYQLPLDDHLMADDVISAPHEAIESLIQYIDEKYGGVEQYLISIGLTENELASIRANIMKS